MWTTINLAVNIYCRLYWAHVLIRHYLRTGRKYALIKKYVLNKHVRLLTRLYGTCTSEIYKIFTPRACARDKIFGCVVVVAVAIVHKKS